jgi:phage major head subunit gpT-like protein
MALGEALGMSWALANNTRLNTDGWGTGSTRRMVVARSDNPVKPFIRQQAEAASAGALAEGSEFEFHHNAHQYGVTAESGVGYGLWEHAVLVEFAA